MIGELVWSAEICLTGGTSFDPLGAGAGPLGAPLAVLQAGSWGS